jgi:hypothetical protein
MIKRKILHLQFTMQLLVLACSSGGGGSSFYHKLGHRILHCLRKPLVLHPLCYDVPRPWSRDPTSRIPVPEAPDQLAQTIAKATMPQDKTATTPRIWAAGLAPMTLLGTKIYAIVPTRLEFRRARINHRNQYRTEVVRTRSLDALCLRSKPCVIACHKHGGTRLSFCSGDSARLKLPSSSSAASRAQIK